MRIESRYNGPAGSGNGGWSAGVFAAEAGGTGPVEVTLRRPPPLETALTPVDGEVRDPDGELVAEVRPAEVIDAVVPPVDLDDGGGRRGPLPRPGRASVPRLLRLRPAAGRRAADLPRPAARRPDRRAVPRARAGQRAPRSGRRWTAPAAGRCSRRAARTCWAGSPRWSRRCPGRATSAW